MAGDERVRHCNSCDLDVFNIGAMSTADAKKLISTRTGRLCVKLYRRPDRTVLTKDCPIGLRAYRKRIGRVAGAVLTTVLGLFSASFGQKASDKPIDARKVKIERSVDLSKTNRLTGQVLDPFGAVIPDAQLTLSRSGEKLYAASDSGGHYSFVDIPAGKWNLSIKSSGFKKFKLNNVALKSNEQLTFDAVLDPNSVHVEIGLLGDDDRRSIDLSSSGATTTISNRKINTLPHDD